ncbi:MAG: hypothetical protein Q9160_005900 [Pyrenula sp. 1 TL-2023]
MADLLSKSPVRKSAADQCTATKSNPDPQPFTSQEQPDKVKNDSIDSPSTGDSTSHELRWLYEQLVQRLENDSRQRSELIWTLIYPVVGLLIAVVFGFFSVFASFDALSILRAIVESIPTQSALPKTTPSFLNKENQD